MQQVTVDTEKNSAQGVKVSLQEQIDQVVDLNDFKSSSAADLVGSALSYGFEDIEAELRAFEEAERSRLGLEEEVKEHWVDDVNQKFLRSARESTTILHCGLTIAQDTLIESAIGSLGYNTRALDVPDNEAFAIGKEFGNRGQCNPTYFTVGNLLKHLLKIEKEEGLTKQEVVDKYLFLTAGACGPCRFGSYTTEYRKVLRDAGFDGFRIMLFQQQGGLKQATGEEGSGLELNPKFFMALLKALIAGDVINAMGYRIRPYEVEKGATDKVIEDCKALLCDTFRQKKSILWGLYKCRKMFNSIEVDRLQPKPKVMIIGEFWAMTTEGDGNYRLQRFLEQEGAECNIQLVTAWLLYNIWQHKFDTKRRQLLRGTDSGKHGLEGKDSGKKLKILWFAEKALRSTFQAFAKAIGLNDYKLADQDEIAEVAKDHYPNELRGGEGHMEVGKVILATTKKKAHMVLSVKPFGCMPSSGVSDGVQSLIVKQFPSMIFCPIETSGDGAVNVQSRVQMFLFKARKKAKEEFDALLEEKGLTLEEARKRVKKSKAMATYYPKHVDAGTANNALHEVK